MRLFLNGGGDGQQTIVANGVFYELLDCSKPLLYVPLAMETELYQSCYQWITGEFKDFDMPLIEMVTSSKELYFKKFEDYCAIFIGGGNTFKLLSDLKTSGSFDKIRNFIDKNGIVFGGSAGAIIFGENLDSCIYADNNDVGLTEIDGFDVLNGVSFLCHYTNESDEMTKRQTHYLLELSSTLTILALPEEDTIYIHGDNISMLGDRPYYIFKNRTRLEYNIENLKSVLDDIFTS